MPFLKKAQTHPPQSAVLDRKTQKRGLRGTIYAVNGDEYTGEWQNNEKHGYGTQLWKKSGAVYEGDWKFGKRDGYGINTVFLPEKDVYAVYRGEWKRGKKHGAGTYFHNTVVVYEGEWSEDQRSGWGRQFAENGDVYEGEWQNDKQHGEGILRFANGNWYDGSWRDGKKNGNGRFCYTDKGQLYEGVWVDGVAKCGTVSDIWRYEAPAPAMYPIPEVKLVDMHMVLNEAKSAHLDPADEEKSDVATPTTDAPLKK